MFGKSWNKLWKSFGEVMESVPDVIEDAIKDGGAESIHISDVNGKMFGVVVKNGKVVIRGDVEGLRINGKTIRLPDAVMKGESK